MDPSCPWAGWQPPNIDWCEAHLCAWIRTPANTWSNLAYILAAIPMWRDGRAHSRGKLFAVASVMVGVTSFAYHASVTYAFQLGDFLGMFAFVALPLTINAVRLGWVEPRRESFGLPLIVGFGAALLLLARYITFPIQLIVGVMIVGILVQELMLRYVRRTPESRRLFLTALGLMGAGYAVWTADLTRVFCDPQNHWVQGHAMWHLFGAGGLLALSRFYRDLEGHSAAGLSRSRSSAAPA